MRLRRLKKSIGVAPIFLGLVSASPVPEDDAAAVSGGDGASSDTALQSTTTTLLTTTTPAVAPSVRADLEVDGSQTSDTTDSIATTDSTQQAPTPTATPSSDPSPSSDPASSSSTDGVSSAANPPQSNSSLSSTPSGSSSISMSSTSPPKASSTSHSTSHPPSSTSKAPSSSSHSSPESSSSSHSTTMQSLPTTINLSSSPTLSSPSSVLLSPSPSQTNGRDNSSSRSTRISPGAIAGIAIGLLAGLGAAILLVLYLWRRRQFRKRQSAAADEYFDDGPNMDPGTPITPRGFGPSGFGPPMLERPGLEKPYNFALQQTSSNDLLSPATARDPFTTAFANRRPAEHNAQQNPMYSYAYDNSSVVPDPLPVESQPQRLSATQISDADLAVSYPAAGRLATYPAKKSWMPKKGKLAAMTYRPNSTLTDSERNSARTLLRMESASSHDEQGRAAKTDEGAYELTSPSTLRSFDTAHETDEDFIYRQYLRQSKASALQSPIQTTFAPAQPSLRLHIPSDVPERPESEEVPMSSLIELLTQRASVSANAADPQKPPPAHIPDDQWEKQDNGHWSGSSTFGEVDTFGRTSAASGSWNGGKAF